MWAELLSIEYLPVRSPLLSPLLQRQQCTSLTVTVALPNSSTNLDDLCEQNLRIVTNEGDPWFAQSSVAGPTCL